MYTTDGWIKARHLLGLMANQQQAAADHLHSELLELHDR